MAKELNSAVAKLPKKNNGAIEVHKFTREQIELVKKTVANGASDDELKLFLYTAQRSGLDPLAKQIHFVKRKRKNAKGAWEEVGSIQTGIDGFRAIADRTGKLSGIKRGATYDEKGNLVGAWAEVYRKDWEHPAREEVRFKEYVQTYRDKNTGELRRMGLWASKPETMIKKCAEAAALRMAFPQDLSGVYSDDEMSAADSQTHTPEATDAIPMASTKQLKAIYAISQAKGKTQEEMKEELAEKYGIQSSKELTLSQASEEIDRLNKLPDAEKLKAKAEGEQKEADKQAENYEKSKQEQPVVIEDDELPDDSIPF